MNFQIDPDVSNNWLMKNLYLGDDKPFMFLWVNQISTEQPGKLKKLLSEYKIGYEQLYGQWRRPLEA